MRTITHQIISLLAAAAMVSSLAAAEQTTKKKKTPSQRIDALVKQGLSAQEMEPNPKIDDHTFVRRIYLDIAGRIPTQEETSAFVEQKHPKKRDRLIDELLESDAYVSNYYHFWADLLRARTAINGNNLGSGSGRAYEAWIKQALRENKPYDEMVRELITATGHSWENGAVGYYLRDYGMPLDNTAMTAQVFLGTQIVCAQCHNHPFDKWTQMDYYHMAAFTYGMMTTNNLPSGNQSVQQAIGQMPRTKNFSQDQQRELRRSFSEILKPVRFNNVIETKRRVKLPHDYAYSDAKPKSTVKPASIMGPEAVISPNTPLSESFADWLTSPENPRFTKVIANRLWKRAFGLGLIEPVDNITDRTTASNPELLDYLEQLLRDLDYDMRAYLAAIYKSQSYQRAATLEEHPLGAPYYFQGPILRRMTSEQVWDSLVGMFREDPDSPDEMWELKGRGEILRRQIVGEAIYNQPAKAIVKHGLNIREVQGQLSERIDAAVAQLTEARETGDQEKISAATREVQKVRRELVVQIERQVYLAGLQHGLDKPQSLSSEESEQLFTELAAYIQEQKPDSEMTSVESVIDAEGGIIRDITQGLLAKDLKALRSKQEKQKDAAIERWGVDTKQEKVSFKNFALGYTRFIRASEMPSPAPAGHFLREFGQSDREMINNSNDQAAVTQALTMLNGQLGFALANPYSKLSRAMKGMNGKERLEHLYLSFYSRPPSDYELKLFQQSWKSDPEAASFSSMAWTLLNTRQFLFVN